MAITAIENDPDQALFNSYVSLTEADQYIEDNIAGNTTAWDAESDDTKTQALFTAMRQLDNEVMWLGAKTIPTQNQQFPRSFLKREGWRANVFGVSVDSALDLSFFFKSDTIPQFIKDAQVEQAWEDLISNKTVDDDSVGIKSVKTGSVGVVFDNESGKQFDETGIFPRRVWLIIKWYCEFPETDVTFDLLRI